MALPAVKAMDFDEAKEKFSGETMRCGPTGRLWP